MNNREGHRHMFIPFAGIVFSLTAAIAVSYVWLLPSLFPGLATYWILVAGAVSAAFLSGRAYLKVKQENGPRNRTLTTLITFLVATFAAILVTYLSLLIIVNTRGV